MKGAMTDWVRGEHFSKLFISIEKAAMISLSKIVVSTNKFISNNFSKLLFWTAFSKEQWSAPFVQHHVHRLLLEKNQQE